MLQSTSSALVATSRTKVFGFQRSLASRNQPGTPTPPPPTSSPVHIYAQTNKPRISSTVGSPFEPRPSQLLPPQPRGWRILNPLPLPRLSSWSRALHLQSPPALPALLPPTPPARSIERVGLRPSPLSIQKTPRALGDPTIYNPREQQSNIGRKLLPKKSPRRIMTQCVYVPWLIHGDSAQSAEWNAFLGSSTGHHYCLDFHC